MKIYFWSKSATKPKRSIEDMLHFNEVTVEEDIHSLLQALEKKIEKWRDFESDVEPENSSVKEWINKIMEAYPERRDDEVKYLIDTFRASLNTKSKEADKFLVGVLLMKDVLVIVHSRKDPSLAEVENELYSVRVVLHPKNIIRADIIKRTEKGVIFGAFEYSRRLSRGHARFWGIESDDIGWESLGTIRLNIELEGFSLPIQLPVEQDELKELIDNGIISPTGKIRISKMEGKIISVFVHNKKYEYSKFYDLFITLTENLERYQKKFKEFIPEIFTYDTRNIAQYKYLEDEKAVYEVGTAGEEVILKKEHPQYTVCFLTNSWPGIKPKSSFLLKIYQSIFNDGPNLKVWHAGEKTSIVPFKVGGLEIYNQVEIPEESIEFSKTLLDQIKDSQSRKGRLLLEYLFCKMYSENLTNRHLKTLFEFISEDILKEEIAYEFKTPGTLQTEDILEFKSADEVLGKPSRFVKEKLVPTLLDYIDGPTRRYCVVYGIEDGFSIKPIYHLKNDMIAYIEKMTNDALSKKNVKIHILPIPYKDGLVLAVYIIPKYGGD